MSNPWQAVHRAHERAYHEDGDIEASDRIVDGEYEGQEPMQCPECKGTTYWKATVGAYKCPSCGCLSDSSGEAY